MDSPQPLREWAALVTRLTPPGGRSAFYRGTGDESLISADKRTTVALLYPRGNPSNAPYEQSLPAIEAAVEQATIAGAPVELTGQPVLSGRNSGAQRGPAYETAIGALGALVVLALVFGSFLAFAPLLMAAVAIPTTFLLVRGVTSLTDVSFIVQFLVALAAPVLSLQLRPAARRGLRCGYRAAGRGARPGRCRRRRTC